MMAGSLPCAQLGHLAYPELRRLAEQATPPLPYTTNITQHLNKRKIKGESSCQRGKLW